MVDLKRILHSSFLAGMIGLFLTSCTGLSNLSKKSYLLGSGKDQIRTGDLVKINFDDYPEFNQTVLVPETGKVTLRGLGKIKIVGLTTKTFEAFLARKYGSLLTGPKAAVKVKRVAIFKVFVGGQVQQPGLIRFKGNLTALQAIRLAGGLKDNQDGFEIVIFRPKEAGGLKMFKFKLGKDHKRELRRKNFELAPYDVVYVKRLANKKNVEGRLI